MISNPNDKNNPELAEEHFSTVFDHLNRIDGEMANLINNYNDGQGSLASLRFENPDISESISTKGFIYGPALTTLKIIDGKYCLVRNAKNPQFLIEDSKLKEELAWEKNLEKDYSQAESLEEFQKRVLNDNQNQNKKDITKRIDEENLNVDDEEILNRFGNLNTSIRLFAAINSFNKALDNLINMANELHILKTKYSLQKIHI